MKKYLYGSLMVILLGGLIFGITRPDILMGVLQPFAWPFSSTAREDQEFQKMTLDGVSTSTAVVDDSELAKTYLEEIDAAETNLLEMVDSAETALSEVEDAYTADDQTTLDAALAEMEVIYSDSNTEYSLATEQLGKIEDLYGKNEEEYATLKADTDALEVVVKDKMQGVIDTDFAAAEKSYNGAKTFYEASKASGFLSSDLSILLDISKSQYDYMSKIKSYMDTNLDTVTIDTSIKYIEKLKTAEPAKYEGIVKTNLALYVETEYGNLMSASAGIGTEKTAYDNAYGETYAEAEILGGIKSSLMSAQDLIENISGYIDAIQGDYNQALSYEPVESCGTIALIPVVYEMEREDTTAEFEFAIKYRKLGIVSWLSLPKFFQADTATTLDTFALPTYYFTVETDGSGTFYDETSGTYINPIEVEIEDGGSKTIKFKGGVSGNVISVTDKTMPDCSKELVISQKSTFSRTNTPVAPTIPTVPTTGTTIPTVTTPSKEPITTPTEPTTPDATVPETTVSDATTTDSDSELSIISVSGNQNLPEEDQKVLEDEEYVCEDNFTDTEGHWAQEIICRVFSIGAVSGKSEGIFDPEADITKAEAMKVLTILSEKFNTEAESSETQFSDIAVNEWSYPYLVSAEINNIIRTRDFGSNFYPNSAVSRGDLVLYAARAIGITNYDFEITYSDFDENDYYAYAVESMSQKTVDVPYDNTTDQVPVIEGYEDGTFKPNNPITRAEAVAVLYRMYLAYIAN